MLENFVFGMPETHGFCAYKSKNNVRMYLAFSINKENDAGSSASIVTVMGLT